EAHAAEGRARPPVVEGGRRGTKNHAGHRSAIDARRGKPRITRMNADGIGYNEKLLPPDQRSWWEELCTTRIDPRPSARSAAAPRIGDSLRRPAYFRGRSPRLRRGTGSRGTSAAASARR